MSLKLKPNNSSANNRSEKSAAANLETFIKFINNQENKKKLIDREIEYKVFDKNQFGSITNPRYVEFCWKKNNKSMCNVISFHQESDEFLRELSLFFGIKSAFENKTVLFYKRSDLFE